MYIRSFSLTQGNFPQVHFFPVLSLTCDEIFDDCFWYFMFLLFFINCYKYVCSSVIFPAACLCQHTLVKESFNLNEAFARSK